MVKVLADDAAGFLGTKMIKGYILIKIEAQLEDDDDERLYIPEKEAVELLQKQQDYLATSNTGSEAIANAQIFIEKPVEK